MSVDNKTRKERLKEIGNNEVKKLVAISKTHQAAVESAKTSTKKKYHTRKLYKNNSELAQMLISLEEYNDAIDREIAEEETDVGS